MQLDKLVVDLRPRSPWEGIDLGQRLAQRFFPALFMLWWIAALPVLLLGLLLLHSEPAWLALFMWWFKPLYEPMLVFWLGRRLFGDRLSLREVAGAWRGILLPRMPANLLWRRFSVNRSLYMPVAVLEGQRGRDWSRRVRVLAGRRSDGAWLTIAGAHFEAVIEILLVFGVLTLLPGATLSGADFGVAFAQSTGWSWVWLCVQLLAMSLIAPFYVAGGFALYLTRRTRLEGWDLELDFRRIAARLAAPLLAAPLLCVLLLGAVPGVASAGDVTPETAHAAAAEVLADKDFGEWKTVTRWQPRENPDAKGHDSGRLDLGWLASLLEALLWVAAAVGIAWLAHLAWRARGRMSPVARQRRPDPVAARELFDARPVEATLPDDIPATALDLVREGKARESLGLLYRASLARLAGRQGLALPAAATECECRSLVARHRPAAQAAYFTRLTDAWMAVAYAHRVPAAADLRALCNEWGRHFEQVADEG